MPAWACQAQIQSKTNNYRNGYSGKALETGVGSIEIAIPRDRESGFEPRLMKKRQTRFAIWMRLPLIAASNKSVLIHRKTSKTSLLFVAVLSTITMSLTISAGRAK